MVDVLFDLYSRCFPNYPMNRDMFGGLIEPETAHCIFSYDGGKAVGASVVRDGSIPLMCVDGDYRGRGLGGELLKQSEEYIKSKGGQKVTLGNSGQSMFQGVPTDSPDTVSFFEKRGYFAEYSSVNMRLPLEKYQPDKISIPKKPNEIEFRFAERTDRNSLLAAVKDADEDWLGIFEDRELSVMVADLKGEVVGFQIVSPSHPRFLYNDSHIGCVGVVKRVRNKGIGLSMFAQGAGWLKKNGCRHVEVLYTYGRLISWYGKLGAYVNSEQWMGIKEI